MKKLYLTALVLLIIGVLLVGCTSPKSSSGESSAPLPELSQPNQTQGNVPVTSADAAATDPGTTGADRTDPASAPSETVVPHESTASETVDEESGGLTAEDDPTVTIGEGSVELIGGD